MTHPFQLRAIAAALGLLAFGASVSAATVSVGGTADLYNGTSPGAYDGTAPVAIDVTGLTSISFSVSTGQTVTVNGGNYNDADGVGSVSGEFNTGTSTLSGITAPTAGFLAGAFVGTTLSAAPTALDFSVSGTSFASLSPELQQAFFIGDGRTGDASGAVQTFYVPAGATTLYLGLTDACGYSGGPSCFSDNAGAFSVTTQGVTSTLPAVPEPANTALLLGGLGAIGIAARRRRAGSAQG
jgi:hypothetical protein